MPSFIIVVCGLLLSLIPQKSLAQLDLDDLMTDTSDVVEVKEAPTVTAVKATKAVTETVTADSEIAEDAAPSVQNAEDTLENSVAEIADSDVAASPDDEDYILQSIAELSEQTRQQTEAQKAKSKALRLVLQKDNEAVLPDDTQELFKRSEEILKEQKKLLQANEMPEIKTPENLPTQPKSPEIKKDPVKEDNTLKAPFGLTWGASREDTEAAGFNLSPAKVEDYVNAYMVNNPQQQRAAFEKVTAIFGEQNHLQMIYAQSAHIQDTPNADKVLRLYHDYYAALEKKYGNAKEHYHPNRGQTSLKEIGNDEFLQELAQKKASLFANFDNDVVLITLSVFADDDEHSFITLIYENKQIKQQEREENLNELVNDL